MMSSGRKSSIPSPEKERKRFKRMMTKPRNKGTSSESSRDDEKRADDLGLGRGFSEIGHRDAESEEEITGQTERETVEEEEDVERIPSDDEEENGFQRHLGRR